MRDVYGHVSPVMRTSSTQPCRNAGSCHYAREHGSLRGLRSVQPRLQGRERANAVDVSVMDRFAVWVSKIRLRRRFVSITTDRTLSPSWRPRWRPDSRSPPYVTRVKLLTGNIESASPVGTRVMESIDRIIIAAWVLGIALLVLCLVMPTNASSPPIHNSPVQLMSYRRRVRRPVPESRASLGQASDLKLPVVVRAPAFAY